jgi:hypothetical protein
MFLINRKKYFVILIILSITNIYCQVILEDKKIDAIEIKGKTKASVDNKTINSKINQIDSKKQVVKRNGNFFITLNSGLDWYPLNFKLKLNDDKLLAYRNNIISKKVKFNPEINDNNYFIKDEFIIYPNPTIDKINISESNHQKSEFGIEVYDQLGNLLFAKFNLYDDSTIDMTDFSSGIYIVCFLNNEQERISFKTLIKY